MSRARDLGAACPDTVADELVPLWTHAANELTGEQLDDVRFLRPDEVPALVQAGFTLGAHTVTHPRLALAPAGQRVREVVESVERVRAWAGRHDVPFAYPNGRARDFGESDVATLRDAGVTFALTTAQGVNYPGVHLDPYRVKRLAISQRRSRDDFLAVISGLYDDHCWWRAP